MFAIQVKNMIRLVTEIGQFRHAHLHAVRHLVLGNARGDFRITDFEKLHLVELGQVVKQAAPDLATDALRVGQVQHRLAGCSKLDPLQP